MSFSFRPGPSLWSLFAQLLPQRAYDQMLPLSATIIIIKNEQYTSAFPNNNPGVAVQRQWSWSATAYFFRVFNLQWTSLIYLCSLHYHSNWIHHSLRCTYPHNTTARYGSTIIPWLDSQIIGLHSKSSHYVFTTTVLLLTRLKPVCIWLLQTDFSHLLWSQ